MFEPGELMDALEVLVVVEIPGNVTGARLVGGAQGELEGGGGNDADEGSPRSDGTAGLRVEFELLATLANAARAFAVPEEEFEPDAPDEEAVVPVALAYVTCATLNCLLAGVKILLRA